VSRGPLTSSIRTVAAVRFVGSLLAGFVSLLALCVNGLYSERVFTMFQPSHINGLMLSIHGNQQVRVVVSNDKDGFQFIRIFGSDNITPLAQILVSCENEHHVTIERVGYDSENA
jgi:hypothetical protein